MSFTSSCSSPDSGSGSGLTAFYLRCCWHISRAEVDDSKSWSTYENTVIIGCVVGGVVAFAVLIAILLCVLHERQKRRVQAAVAAAAVEEAAAASRVHVLNGMQGNPLTTLGTSVQQEVAIDIYPSNLHLGNGVGGVNANGYIVAPRAVNYVGNAQFGYGVPPPNALVALPVVAPPVDPAAHDSPYGQPATYTANPYNLGSTPRNLSSDAVDNIQPLGTVPTCPTAEYPSRGARSNASSTTDEDAVKAFPCSGDSPDKSARR